MRPSSTHPKLAPVVTLLALALAALAPGCGPNCQSTCDKLFLGEDDAPGACGIEHPGKSADEERGDCIKSCEDALAEAGPIPAGYSPNERQTGSQSVKLETDEQAAAWMECVDETACDYLTDGYCAPVWF